MSQIKTKFIENLAVTNAKIANSTIDLTAKVTGVLPVANGGTGQSAIVSALVDGATPALDASLGSVFTLTSTQNPTIAVPTNPTNGQKITIVFTASGANRTLSLNSSAGGFKFGNDITALTATTSGTIDYIGCIYNSTSGFWNVVAYVKGF